MDKLISAEKLLDRLRGNVLVDVTPELEKTILEMPAAFDKEKVIEKLKAQRKWYSKRGKEYEQKGFYSIGEKFIAKAYSYKHALEIVKKGGV